jgi:proteasome lid subunit RPN8/RPN11
LSIPFRLLIPRRHYDELIAQAKTELPNECCGLLAGVVEESSVGRVMERYPLVNNAASPTEYLANDQTLFRAYRHMRERGFDLLAIYHSHPVTEPVPSRTDLARNYFEGVMHLIVSLKSAEPFMRAWWLGENDYREAEWECAEIDRAGG